MRGAATYSRFVVASLVVLALALAGGASTAHAGRSATNPIADPGVWDDIYGKLRTTASSPRMFLCEAPTSPVPCTPDQLKAIEGGRRTLGMLPKLRVVGTLVLVGTAFEAGWQIGRVIDTKWLHLSAPFHKYATADATSWTWIGGPQADGNSYWMLDVTLNAYSFGLRRVFPTGPGGVACPAGGSGCGGSTSEATKWNNYRSEALKVLPDSPGAVWIDYRALIGNPTYNCGAGSAGSGCYVLAFEEAAMEQAAGANGPLLAANPAPAKPVISSSITMPSATPTAWSDPLTTEVVGRFLADETAAEAAAGTPAEETTAAWEGGRNADPLRAPNTDAGETSAQRPSSTPSTADDWEGYPLPMVTMPDCVGLSAAACAAALVAAGWGGDLVELELGIGTADVTRPAGAVVTQSVGAGTSIESEADVTLHLNPDPMPLLLPEPLLGETYDAYLARLVGLGWVGAVAPHIVPLDLAVPKLGPDAPLRVGIPLQPSTLPDPDAPPTTVVVGDPWPSPVPRIWPDTDLEIWRNPDDVPPIRVPLPGTPASDAPDDGSECECEVDEIELPAFPSGACDKFPFGVFCWVADQVELFGGAADAPHVTFDADLSGLVAGLHPHMALDAADTPTVITGYFPFIRNALGFTIWLIGLWVLGRRMLNLNPPDALGADGGEPRPDEESNSNGYKSRYYG